MRAAEYINFQPTELAMFKTTGTMSSSSIDQPEIEIPERAENRVPTDKKFLTALGIMLIILLPFLIYTLCYSDIDRFSYVRIMGRFSHGQRIHALPAYDQCGNICGKKNTKYDQWLCTGQDYTDKKLLQFDGDIDLREGALIRRHCVSYCESGYGETLSGYCFKGESSSNQDRETNGLLVFLQSMAWRLTFLCFLSLGVALSMLYLFRVATAVMVWGVLMGVLTALVISVGFLWYICLQPKNEGIIVLAIFLTVLILILLAVIVFLYKKIFLVIAIFKEAMKAIFAMPHLLLIPILTFLADLLVAAVFVTALGYMFSSGVLTEVEDGYLEYQQNIVMQFSIVFSFWMIFWVSQFLTGIQYMVIAGAVSKWYFAENKDYLDRPISTSASITFKFHLGSIAFGSLIIDLMAIVRSLSKNKMVKACLGFIADVAKYLSKNSYIIIAMHGQPFYKSGKRATRILFKDVINIATHNYVGHFILFMASVLVGLISLLFTYLVMLGVTSPDESNWIVYVIVAVVSPIVAAFCFSIFMPVIDTIYLCFCEDKLLNDGMARPYAMSTDLMEFIENSKKVFGEKKT